LLGQSAPVGVAVLLDVGDEPHVLLRHPRPLVQPDLGAARCPAFPHLSVSKRLLRVIDERCCCSVLLTFCVGPEVDAEEKLAAV
jgi:hypothetical protein